MTVDVRAGATDRAATVGAMSLPPESLPWTLRGWEEPALLDHAGTLREDPGTLNELWHRPSSRLLLLDDGGRYELDPFGEPTGATLGDQPPESVAFLGMLDQVAWFARRDDQPHHHTVRETRLDPGQRQIVVAAVAVLNWYRNNQYCAVCGGPLRRTKGGYAAQCAQCGREAFPRTDPAIICGVRDTDDRLYLAHQSSWEPGRVSILAGFIEAGESAEQAVHREIREEADLRVFGLQYLGSQPWPMPRSLMFSYLATSSDAGRVDGDELSWGAWFSREEVRASLADRTLSLPAGSSVGHRIIFDWLAGRLPGSLGHVEL